MWVITKPFIGKKELQEHTPKTLGHLRVIYATTKTRFIQERDCLPLMKSTSWNQEERISRLQKSFKYKYEVLIYGHLL